jgi:hypothetical protein
LSGAATSSGYWTGSICGVQDTDHNKIGVFSTFITDILLLALMLVGVLRWREVRQRGSIWWLLYAQVSLSHPARVGLDL